MTNPKEATNDVVILILKTVCYTSIHMRERKRIKLKFSVKEPSFKTGIG